MSVPISHPPIPKQPIGTTFTVSISFLGFVAVIQLFAVAWHYIPLVHQQIAESTAARPVEPGEPALQPAPSRPIPPQPAQTQADMLKAKQLFSDSAYNYRVGNYEEALKLIEQVEAILPGDPVVLMRKADVLQQLSQPAEAVLALEQALKYPGLPAATRDEVQKKLDLVSQSLGPSDTRSVPDTAALPDTAGADLREDIGIQPGATLGIVKADVRDVKTGTKSLRVAVKSRPDAAVNVQDVKIVVYFYEETEDGEVLLTESKVLSQWQSPPIDWAENEPEILDVQYVLPDSDLPGSAKSNGLPGRKYHGYLVGIYYNKELQDFRADPAKLGRDFPLPLYLKEGAE